jgi:hypothetical protein
MKDRLVGCTCVNQARCIQHGMFGWMYGCTTCTHLHGGMQNLAPSQARWKRAAVSFLQSQALAGLSHAARPAREENQTRPYYDGIKHDPRDREAPNAGIENTNGEAKCTGGNKRYNKVLDTAIPRDQEQTGDNKR